jgi:NAD(P)-dependent dehydrogenase (short-subunit alcohol dehydrogenase family)
MFPSVSDSQQIQDALKAVLDDFGKIDVYVANAGEHFPYYRARMSLRELRNI